MPQCLHRFLTRVLIKTGVTTPHLPCPERRFTGCCPVWDTNNWAVRDLLERRRQARSRKFVYSNQERIDHSSDIYWTGCKHKRNVRDTFEVELRYTNARYKLDARGEEELEQKSHGFATQKRWYCDASWASIRFKSPAREQQGELNITSNYWSINATLILVP